MKSCPTCKRTYADETLTFCLADGSLLSAPYDPHETLHLPAPRVTDPIPTPPLPSTIQSTPAPPLYSEKSPPQLKEKQGSNPWMIFGLAMSLVSLVTVGVLLSFVWFGKDQVVSNQTDANVANTNSRPTATPTATVGNGGWGPIQQASINQGDGQILTYYVGTTPEQCQSDCTKNPGCKAFTFIRPGAYNPNDPQMCYLMSQAQRMTPSPCCLSAIKR
jgi:hypothetical protein